MAINNRFLFDNEFGSEASSPQKEATKPAEREVAIYTQSDVDAMKAEAFESGVRQGQDQSLQGVESALAGAMNSINAQLQELLTNHDAKLLHFKQESANLAYIIASKLAPALIELTPEKEVRKVIEECLEDLQDEPRIVIRANDEVCQKISEKIGEITANSVFQGNLIMLPDETKHASDCRVEWADGGAERRLEDIQSRLEEVINRFVQSTGKTHQDEKSNMDQPSADQV